MKRFSLLLMVISFGALAHAQDLSKFKLYKPGEDATAAIASAVKEANASGKHVFVQIGGNWCIWCARFNDFVTNDSSIDSLMKANYVVYHLNYSPENYNEAVLARYGYPQRFGFPVFLVLDGNGKLLHTQNSSYLEEKKGYSRVNVIGFFKDWSPAAFEPSQYKQNK